jgi:PAS domain S-box-containing protein
MTGDVRVLCVDDDPEVAELSATYLRRELGDASVRTATDAASALEVLDDDVDCVVSDYEMPGRSGLELLRAVRERDADLPFILFTGKVSEAIASDAISAGVTDYLQKRGPEGYELLANRVENAVSQWRAQRNYKRAREKTARLHETALALRETSEPDAVYELAAMAAREVLSFDTCGFFTVEDGRFAAETVVDFSGDVEPMSTDEGVIGEVYRTGEPWLVDDVQKEPVAAPASESFHSCITVPVGDDGVFQALADEPGFFDGYDLELAELLVAHVSTALDRIDSEQDFERTYEQLETVLETTTANIYIKDCEGRYQLINDQFADRLGKAREDIIGRTDEEIQDPDVATEVRRNDRRAIEEGHPIEVEESAEWDGEQRVYYSVKAPIYDDDGEPKGVCGVSSDITELKRREEELQRKTERLDEFVSVVSHDLRNPLTVAQGHAEMLEADEEIVHHLQASLDRMEEIVDELLALARSGRQLGDTETVDVATVARQAWSTVETSEATLTLDVDRTVDADPGRLRQLFENLFRNAIEHAGDGPEVRVETCDIGFAVADDGPGLPPEIREEISSSGLTLAGDESGFGMAIVERIAEAHGWTITLPEMESGARFEFAV